MSEPKTFASLTPTLLARKGAAKPAMRPQLHPIQQFKEVPGFDFEDDLGWNDHGDDFAANPGESSLLTADEPVSDGEAEVTGQVVSLNGEDLTGAEIPEIVRQQETVLRRIAVPAAPRGSALASGRRVAFTLRLDPERHLRLRLASTICNRSAQQIVTEALDRLIEEMPEVEALASRLNKRS